jgi:regulator of cell morphogenesis and NO signaling
MFSKDQTVAEIVAADYRAAGIFKKYGMDFCCGGKKPVTEACQKHGVNTDSLMEELNFVTAPDSYANIDYSKWTPELLVTYIEEMHHNYVKEAIPRIGMFTEKVAMRHGDSQPELIEVHQTFLELGREMLSHMQDEEDRVFPAITQFVKTDNPDMVLIHEMLAELEQEHEQAGALMAKLRALTNGFAPPEWACNTYRVSFAELEAFETDLHKHVHLENNILFPKIERLAHQMTVNSH